jgi:hypothetical protein
LSEEAATQELRELAKLTMMNNRISSVQIKNLKLYALVYFDGIDSANIEYDVSTKRETEVELDTAENDAKYTVKVPSKSGSKITYNLDIRDGTENANLKYRCEVLERSVRNLFWSDLTVEVVMNEKLVFRSGENV